MSTCISLISHLSGTSSPTEVSHALTLRRRRRRSGTTSIIGPNEAALKQPSRRPAYGKPGPDSHHLAFAGDLASGLEFDDGIRSCYAAVRIAEELGLSDEERSTVYYVALLKDGGCTCWTSQEEEFWQTDEIAARRDLLFFGGATSLRSFIGWMGRYVGSDLAPIARIRTALNVFRDGNAFMHEGFASAAEVCTRIAERLGLSVDVQEGLTNITEQWDGKGEPRGIKGEQVPIASRVVMPTFLIAPVGRVAGREAVADLMRRGRGKAFDPRLVDAYLKLSADDSFWDDLQSENILTTVLDREPKNTADATREDEAVALAFADFVDLKSPYTAAHSRRVAAITTQIARLMGCGEEETALYRRAALMHDLGVVAVPSRVLNKQEERLSPSEKELMRLHPYYGERILERVPMMAPFVSLIGNHHESMDGSGFFRGLKADSIPLGARIICIANRLDELTHESAGEGPMEPLQAMQMLLQEGRAKYDKDVLSALLACLDDVTSGHAEPRSWPCGLTDREVEVLRLASKGLTRRQIGEFLSIAESTVRHHLEHIYSKTGASTRVGATMFAMENDLLP